MDIKELEKCIVDYGKDIVVLKTQVNIILTFMYLVISTCVINVFGTFFMIIKKKG